LFSATLSPPLSTVSTLVIVATLYNTIIASSTGRDCVYTACWGLLSLLAALCVHVVVGQSMLVQNFCVVAQGLRAALPLQQVPLAVSVLRCSTVLRASFCIASYDCTVTMRIGAALEGTSPLQLHWAHSHTLALRQMSCVL